VNPVMPAIARRTHPRGWLDWMTLGARCALGGLLLYSGLAKAVHPVEFLKLIREYQIAAAPMALNSVAAFLPWFEVTCGLLLLGGVAVRGTALLALSLLGPFTLLVVDRALAIHAATGGAFCGIRFDCGCGFGEVLVCAKLIENGSLILLAAFLLARNRSPAALRFDLWDAARRPGTR
jgi:uncharacterized membrane protein YphA (DoxX/SURF4 family)